MISLLRTSCRVSADAARRASCRRNVARHCLSSNAEGTAATSAFLKRRPIATFAAQSKPVPSIAIIKRLHRRNDKYSIRSFATASAPPPASGDECYANALRALEMARNLEAQREEQRAAEQYESMIKAREREELRAKERAQKRISSGGASVAASAASQKLAEVDGNQRSENSGIQSRAAGVAVIKTITKQTRKERDNQIARRNGTTDGNANQPSSKDETSQYREEAQKWLRMAAFQHSHPKALARLGNDALEEAKNRLHSSSGTDRSGSSHGDMPSELIDLTPLGRACRLYYLAGEAGAAEGYFNLGHLLWTGFPADEEDETAVEMLDMESSSDFGMDTLPKGDTNVIDADRAMATLCFERAVDMGDADAMFFLGVNLLSVDNASSDHQRQRGLNLIDWAATAGHAGALNYLALFYLNGDAGLDISPCLTEEFVDRLNLAADAGESDALFLRGHCYYSGEDGYEQDLLAALEDFVTAAKAGNADAAISAGAMLYQGEAVPQDRRRAFELYQEAAELGSKDGWRNLVSCYMLGHGVPKSEETAKHIAETMLK